MQKPICLNRVSLRLVQHSAKREESSSKEASTVPAVRLSESMTVLGGVFTLVKVKCGSKAGLLPLTHARLRNNLPE